MAEKDKRFEVRLSEKDVEFLDKISKKSGLKKSEIIRRLLHGKNIKIIDNFDVKTIRNLNADIARLGNFQVQVHSDTFRAKKFADEIDWKRTEIDNALQEVRTQNDLKDVIGKLTIEIQNLVKILE